MMIMNMHEYKEVRYWYTENGFNYVTGGLLSDNPSKLMRLDYYIYETGSEWEFCDIKSYKKTKVKIISYGIGVTRTEDDDFEEKYIGEVTYDQSKANDLMRALAENCVTPCCLREVLEDLCAGSHTLVS